MKALRKFFFALVIAGLAFCLAAAGVVFYVYRHPQRVKGLLENTLSHALDAEVSISSLSFRLQPPGLDAGGIFIRSDSSTDGISGDVDGFRTDLSLSGPFGRRTLTVNTLELSRLRLRMPSDAAVLQFSPGGRASPLVGILEWLVGVFLFREVHLERLRAVDGQFDIFSDEWRLVLGLVEAGWTAGQNASIRGRARFEMPSQGLSADAPEIAVSSTGRLVPGQSALGAEVVIEDGALIRAPAEAKGISLRARLLWDRADNRVRIDTAELKVATLLATRGDAPTVTLEDAGLHCSGSYDLLEEAVLVPEWRLRIEDWVDMGGTVHYGGDHEKLLRVEIAEGKMSAEKIVPLLAGQAGLDGGGWGLSGPLQIGGGFSGRRQGDRWQWDLDGRVQLEGNRLSLDIPAARLRSRLSGGISLKGSLGELGVKSELKLTEGDLAYSGIRLKPFAVELSGEGAYPDFRIATLETWIAELPRELTKTEVACRDVRLTLQNGRVNTAVRSFEFPGGTFTSSLLGPVSVSLAGDMRAQNISVEGRETGILNFIKAAGWWPAGWEVQGRDRLQAAATLKNGRCRFDAGLTLEKLGFEAPQGEALGEKIDLTATAGGDLDLGRRQLDFKAAVRVAAGEALLRQFYFDFNQQPFDFSVEAASEPGLERWQVADLSLELQGVACLRASGRVRSDAAGQQVDLRLILPPTAVGPLARQFILDPFAAGAPFLKTVVLDGTLSADLAIQADQRAQQAAGRLLWSNGDLTIQSPEFAARGATIDFPVWYRQGLATAGGQPLNGRLQIAAIEVPVLGRQAFDWPLRAGPGRLDLLASTRFDFGGGTLVLEPISVEDIYRPDRLLKSEISITSVDTGRFLRTIWPDAALGAVNGRLALAYSEGRLVGTGRVAADVFGGQVTVLNPSIESLFSPAPVLRCDVTLENIRLNDLTAGTAFGKIEGILQGSIQNLEIVDGQPQRFDLVLESERREGVPQRISVKAVNSISQIGGGQNPFVGLAGSAMKLLPGFGYKKIGFRSTLHNDVFTVNGTIKENGTEYLVRRDGLAGVDVINRDPANRIRFKEMVKRIGRALTPEGKPVVNLNQ